jgi:hypothetical protein
VAFVTTPWSLVTAPDEREHCCVVQDGARCTRPTAYKVAAIDGSLDDYTHVCEEHLALVRRDSDVVTSIERA